jgi:hypothetical protein
MFRRITLAAVAVAVTAGLAACTPTFNWRAVRIEFASGRRWVQAVAYAKTLRPEVTDPIFPGLAFE